MSANQKRVGKAPPQESYSGNHYRSWGTGEFNPLGTVRGEKVKHDIEYYAFAPKVRALRKAIAKCSTINRWKHQHGLNEEAVRYDVREYMSGRKPFSALNCQAQNALTVAALYVGITSL